MRYIKFMHRLGFHFCNRIYPFRYRKPYAGNVGIASNNCKCIVCGEMFEKISYTVGDDMVCVWKNPLRNNKKITNVVMRGKSYGKKVG
jgi:hypothetical protein